MRGNKIVLSICIVSWNTCGKLKECLRSVFMYSEGLIIEVIVFDNASSDNTVEMIKSDFPQVTLIENRTNIGFGRGNNIAIKRCRGDYILLINPDIVIKQSTFRRMITSLETHRDAGVIGCKLVNIDGSVQKSFHNAFPTPMSEFFWGIMLHKLYDKVSPRSNKEASYPIQVAWLIGACMLFRTDVLLKLNGFDDQYYMYGEDVDLCFRLHKMGLNAYYLGDIQMLHYHGASSKKQTKSYYAAIMQRESMYKFMLTHYGRFTAFLYRYIWVFSGLARVSLLTPGYIFSLLTFSNRKRIFSGTLEKYARIVSWGLGFEKWTRKGIQS